MKRYHYFVSYFVEPGTFGCVNLVRYSKVTAMEHVVDMIDYITRECTDNKPAVILNFILLTVTRESTAHR